MDRKAWLDWCDHLNSLNFTHSWRPVITLHIQYILQKNISMQNHFMYRGHLMYYYKLQTEFFSKVKGF